MPVEIIDIEEEKPQSRHQARPLPPFNSLRSVKPERAGGKVSTIACFTESDTVFMEGCGPSLSPKTDIEENRWMRMLFECRFSNLFDAMI